MKRYYVYVLIGMMLFGCSKNDAVKGTEVTQAGDSIDNMEPDEELPTFENEEAIDWFFFHNTAESEKVQIRSVMTNKDSTVIIEAYSSNDKFTESMNIKRKDEDFVSVFLANEEGPTHFYVTNSEQTLNNKVYIKIFDDHYALYYESDQLQHKLLISRFVITQEDGQWELSEDLSTTTNKRLEHFVARASCNSEISTYDGTEACLLLAREFWCEKHGRWSNKLSGFLLGLSLEYFSKAFVRNRIMRRLEPVTRHLRPDELKALELSIDVTLDKFVVSGVELGKSINSYIFNDLYKERVINGFCRTYGYELDKNDFLVVSPRPFDDENNGMGPSGLYLEKNGNGVVNAYVGEPLEIDMEVTLKTESNAFVEPYKTEVVWVLSDPALAQNEIFTVQAIELYGTSRYSPVVPKEPGDYDISVFLADNLEVKEFFILHVEERIDEDTLRERLLSSRRAGLSYSDCSYSRTYTYKERPDLNSHIENDDCYPSYGFDFYDNGDFAVNSTWDERSWSLVGNTISIRMSTEYVDENPTNNTRHEYNAYYNYTGSYDQSLGVFVGTGSYSSSSVITSDTSNTSTVTEGTGTGTLKF